MASTSPTMALPLGLAAVIAHAGEDTFGFGDLYCWSPKVTITFSAAPGERELEGALGVGEGGAVTDELREALLVLGELRGHLEDLCGVARG